jgi:hypothetical protein
MSAPRTRNVGRRDNAQQQPAMAETDSQAELPMHGAIAWIKR